VSSFYSNQPVFNSNQQCLIYSRKQFW